MNKKLILLLVGILGVSILSGCSTKEPRIEDQKVPIDVISGKVKTELGENYIPSIQLNTIQLEERTKVKKENIKELVAEIPQMNVHIDEFIA